MSSSFRYFKIRRQGLDQKSFSQVRHNVADHCFATGRHSQEDGAGNRIHRRGHRNPLVRLEYKSDHADLATVNPVVLSCGSH